MSVKKGTGINTIIIHINMFTSRGTSVHMTVCRVQFDERQQCVLHLFVSHCENTNTLVLLG